MTTRLHHIDAMRSVLMLLGVLLHAASIYEVNEIWLVRDTQTWLGFDVFTNVIHQFRMPAFFIVAGLFCQGTLVRLGPGKFLQARLFRVLIPLVSCGLTLNTLQVLILYGPETGFAMLSDPVYWYDGEWVYHLWFLNCLILYFLVAALLYAYAGGVVGKFYRRFCPGRLWTWGGLYLLVLPLITYGVNFLRYQLTGAASEPRVFDFFLASMPWEYSSYFIFGFFLGANKAFREDFSTLRFWLVVAVAGAYYLAFHQFSDQDGLVAKICQRYTQAFVPWGLCVVCFHLFEKLVNKSSKAFSFLADASYSVYLFHQLFVIVFGLMLIGLTINPLIKFMIVVGLTLAASLSIHQYLILRFAVLRLLFNGRRIQAGAAGATGWGLHYRPRLFLRHRSV